MPTSGNVPQHLVVGARTGFLTSLKTTPMPWQRIANQIDMGAKSIDLVDLGAAPMPTEDMARVYKDFVEKSMTIKPRDWSLLVWISRNAVSDDQTGTLERKVKSAGDNFQRHINQRVFSRLNAGDVAGNLSYDGQIFFSAAHVDKGAAYQTAQTNLGGALALTLDNFETVYVAAQSLMDDQGQTTDYVYDTLIVPPAYERIASQITGNNMAYDTANREGNPYAGRILPLVNNQLDSTAWILSASGESVKPMIVAMREAPHLQDYWFDPMADDGGRYCFKFFARYEIHFADWRTAILGHS
jgi:phage major head subunit gpT-like protein